MNGSMMHNRSRFSIGGSRGRVHNGSRFTISGRWRWMHYRNYRSMMYCKITRSWASKKTTKGLHCRNRMRYRGFCWGRRWGLSWGYSGGSRRGMHYGSMMHCMSYGSMATKKTSMGCMHCRGVVNWVGYCRGMVNWMGNCGGMVNCMGYCRGMVHSMGYWGWVGF